MLWGIGIVFWGDGPGFSNPQAFEEELRIAKLEAADEETPKKKQNGNGTSSEQATTGEHSASSATADIPTDMAERNLQTVLFNRQFPEGE